MPRPNTTQQRIIRRMPALGKTLCVLLVFSAAIAVTSSAQTFKTLANFNGTNGFEPIAAMTQSVDGNFYGTAVAGGIHHTECSGSCGTAYEMTPGGTLATLYDFCGQPACADGFAPLAGLLLTLDGSLYGTTSQGGSNAGRAGTVFQINSAGFVSTVDDLADPSLPATTLVQFINGDSYGTTDLGGAHGFGSVFQMTSSGTLTNIYSFNATDGETPSSLVVGRDGNFYGTTTAGGTGNACHQNGCGTVFRLTAAGELTVLHNFCSSNCGDGFAPASLIQATDGYLYGVTAQGGRGSLDGTIFKISLNGNLKTIYHFCSQINCADGLLPQTIIEGSDGNLYGTTLGGGDLTCNTQVGGGCGTAFRITRSGILSTLHTFEGNDGAYAYGLNQATSGLLYGVTSNGGSNSTCMLGCGTVYSLNLGLSPFVSFVFPAAKVGETSGILGQGFTGTTAVSLNGTPMSFTVVSDTFLTATVPKGATTGNVTVTTPGGVLTSNVPFHVIP